MGRGQRLSRCRQTFGIQTAVFAATAQQQVEHRRQQQAEERHAKHAREHGDAHRAAGAGAAAAALVAWERAQPVSTATASTTSATRGLAKFENAMLLPPFVEISPRLRAARRLDL